MGDLLTLETTERCPAGWRRHVGWFAPGEHVTVREGTVLRLGVRDGGGKRRLTVSVLHRYYQVLIEMPSGGLDLSAVCGLIVVPRAFRLGPVVTPRALDGEAPPAWEQVLLEFWRDPQPDPEPFCEARA